MNRGSLRKKSAQGWELFLKFMKTSVTKLTNHHDDPADMCRLSRRLRLWNCGIYDKVIESNPSVLKSGLFNKVPEGPKLIVDKYDELYGYKSLEGQGLRIGFDESQFDEEDKLTINKYRKFFYGKAQDTET